MMKKTRGLGKGFFILSALLLMFAVVGCDDSDSTDRDVTRIQEVDEVAGSAQVEEANWVANETLRTANDATGDSAAQAEATLNANFTPRAADGTSLAGQTITAALAVRDGSTEDVDDADIPTDAEMTAANFDAATQNYVNDLNAGDDLAMAILGEATVTAEAEDGTDVAEFTAAARANEDAVTVRINWDFPLGSESATVVSVAIWRFVPGTGFVPYAFVPVYASEGYGMRYVSFGVRYMGRYVVGMIVDRFEFEADSSITDDCVVKLAIAENGAGSIDGIDYIYSFLGEGSWSSVMSAVNTVTVYGSFGGNQTVYIRALVNYEYFNNFGVTFFKRYLINFDCISGSGPTSAL